MYAFLDTGLMFQVLSEFSEKNEWFLRLKGVYRASVRAHLPVPTAHTATMTQRRNQNFSRELTEGIATDGTVGCGRTARPY